jgi:tetratricopeptide (TPR) repeat protein
VHAAGVIHRDLRPDHLWRSGDTLQILDLDLALVAGLGPVGVVGTSRWRAPELGLRPGTFRSDLYALGAIATWVATRGESDTLPPGSPHRDLIEALRADRPQDRPASAAEVLAHLGETAPPVPEEPPLHPSVAAWLDGRWVDPLLLMDLIWEVPRILDAQAETDRWAIGSAAARILREAAPGRRQAWMVLATLCDMLAERLPSEAEAFGAQVLEALERGETPWHPATAALRRRRDGPGSFRRQIQDLCDMNRTPSAMRIATDQCDFGALAYTAWCQGDAQRAQDMLIGVMGPDPLADRVAASVICHNTPLAATERQLGDALPSAIRTGFDSVLSNHPDQAETWIGRLGGSRGERVRLRWALWRGHSEDALASARALVAEGLWDEAIAACISSWGNATDDPDFDRALRVLDLERPHDVDSALKLARTGLLADPEDLEAWLLLLQALIRAGRGEEAQRLFEFAREDIAVDAVAALEEALGGP